MDFVEKFAEENLDRLPELTRELARLDVDVIFTSDDRGLQIEISIGFHHWAESDTI